MNKAFDFFEWYNLPSMDSPINRSNLMKINYGLEEVDNRVIVLDTTKFAKSEAQSLIKDVTFDLQTGVLTKYYYNGSIEEINTGISKLNMNLRFDKENQILYIVNADGTEDPVDLSVFVTNYEFEDSDTIAHNVSSDGKVISIVKNGSIQEKHLQPNYLADIKVEVAKAQSSATTAAASETNAKASENAAQASQMAAEQSENNAAASATAAAESATTATQESTDAADSANTATAKADEAANSAEIASAKADNASASATAAAGSATTATQKATDAENSASEADAYSKMSQSYAVGTDGEVRENDNSDCAKAYYEQTKRISQGINGIIPMGTITFEELSDPNNQQPGYFFNVSDSFVSDERFKDGAGIFYGAGNNVLRTADGMWDVTAASMVSGVKGDKETEYRQGFVNITCENIGALPVDGNAVSATKATQDGNGNNIAQTYLVKTGDAKDATVTFTSGDSENPTGWADVEVVSTGEKLSGLMRKFSLFAKNVRYLWKLLGTTSLAGIGDGTVTGAINALNSKKTTTYTSINELGITSTFIPDIIAAMPPNSSFKALIHLTGIYENAQNKLSVLSMSSGIMTIDKVASYIRVIITTNNSGGSNGKLYIGTINTNTKEINGWYEISGELKR